MVDTYLYHNIDRVLVSGRCDASILSRVILNGMEDTKTILQGRVSALLCHPSLWVCSEKLKTSDTLSLNAS